MSKIFQPTVVIGLGGTGKGIILALKKMIAENSKGGMTDYPFLKVLSIDTDNAKPSNSSAIKTISESELNLNTERETFSLRTNFNVIPDLKNFPEIDSWFPPSLHHNLIPAELEKGAGQKKPIGRFTFAWNAQDIYTRLQNLLSNPVDVQTAKDRAVGSDNLSSFTNVFICGSICGGTGAGTFLDIAYLVRYIASTLSSRTIYIYGMFSLASMFEGIQGDAQIKPNCYASLMELDNFMSDLNFANPFRQFYPAYKNWNPDYKSSAGNSPFDFPFLFDKGNTDRSLNSPAAFNEMAARFIYLLTGSEVAQDWQSMDNNVRKNLDTTYKKELYNKPINYRSMGTFSVMFPKRMVIQLCAYRLMKEYFVKILDDSYNPQEIENITIRFLNDVKLNPASDQFEVAFGQFRESDGSSRDFTEFLETEKDNLLDEDTAKEEIVSTVRDWKVGMEKRLSEFKQRNSSTGRDVREHFVGLLDKRIAELVDLKLQKDESNLTVDGNPRMIRGSIVRAYKVLSKIESLYSDAKIDFKKKLESAEEEAKNKELDFNTAIDDLEEAVNGFLSTKGKIHDRLETALTACTDYLNAKKSVLIYGWSIELLTDILENGLPKYDGLVKEVEGRRKGLDSGMHIFRDINEEVASFLDNSRRYEPDKLCDVIFDYDTDVEGMFKSVMAEQTEDHVFEQISDALKLDQAFGPSYANIAGKNSMQVIRIILKATEKFFFDPVNKVSIARKLIENPDKLNLLRNGNYYSNARVYLALDGGKLSEVNINLEQQTFFAITVPDEYTGKPCAGLKGSLNSNANERICPVDANPDKFQGKDACPLYGKCLKKIILEHAPQNLAIIPTDENSEVNILQTVAGFPLLSVSSAMNNCRPIYNQLVEKNKKENESRGVEEERVHMFGNVRFDDLGIKTEDPGVALKKFKDVILLAVAVGRLVVQPLSIDFITTADLRLDRRDKPSLHLGRDFDEVYRRFQSTRANDLAAIKQFQDEMGKLLEAVSSNEKQRDVVFAKMKSIFEKISHEIPKGLTTVDLDRINSIAKEKFGSPLVEKAETEEEILV